MNLELEWTFAIAKPPSFESKQSANKTLSTLCQPPAPAAPPRLALGQSRHTFRQAIHDAPPLSSRHAKPRRDLATRAPATDAKTCFRFQHADFHARRFDIGKAAIVHGTNVIHSSRAYRHETATPVKQTPNQI
jgi:hypothetical protein